MNTETLQQSLAEAKMVLEVAAQEVTRIHTQLAEAEKPELRAGAYGYFKDSLSGGGQDKFAVYDFDGSDVLVSINGCRRRMGKEYFRQHIIAILGNIHATPELLEGK